ncbi:MAG: hypothetical protein ACXQS2_03725 [Methermicoccaceae archaeon]
MDTDRWWGIKGDTYTTSSVLKEFGVNEPLLIGDRDRGIHLARESML